MEGIRSPQDTLSTLCLWEMGFEQQHKSRLSFYWNWNGQGHPPGQEEAVSWSLLWDCILFEVFGSLNYGWEPQTFSAHQSGWLWVSFLPPPGQQVVPSAIREHAGNSRGSRSVWTPLIVLTPLHPNCAAKLRQGPVYLHVAEEKAPGN